MCARLSDILRVMANWNVSTEQLKEECLSKQSLIDLDDARRQVSRYIEEYNTQRLHSALYYLTPEDYLEGRVRQRLAERKNKMKQAMEKRKIYAKSHLN